MGEFDGGVKCPKCGTWGAHKSLWKVKCSNPSCEKYNAEYAEGYKQSRVTGRPATEVFPYLKGKADRNDYSFQIRYQNFRGNELLYSANPNTFYRKGEHVVARLFPKGTRASFKLDRIQNRGEVESAITETSQPEAAERRILHYHLRRGTSSPAFEKLRQKYPNYTD